MLPIRNFWGKAYVYLLYCFYLKALVLNCLTGLRLDYLYWSVNERKKGNTRNVWWVAFRLMENDQNEKGSIIFLDVYGSFFRWDVIVNLYLLHVKQKMLQVINSELHNLLWQTIKIEYDIVCFFGSWKDQNITLKSKLTKIMKWTKIYFLKYWLHSIK